MLENGPLDRALATPNGDVLIESFASGTGESRPAVVSLGGSRVFASPVFDDLGQHFSAAGLDAYRVHLLSPADSGAIDCYAERLSDWTTAVRRVVSYLNSQPAAKEADIFVDYTRTIK